MESMDITYSIPRVNWNVSEKMPYSNSFFPKLSKEHFMLKTIYETLYIFFYDRWQNSWLRSYIMSFYWNSTNCISINQGSFGPKIGVTKINCYKTLQSYISKGFPKSSWQVFTEIHILIKINQNNFNRQKNLIQ